MVATRLPKSPKTSDGKGSIILVFRLMKMDTIDMRIKEKTLITWALFWEIDRRDKSGIRMLPPPSPILPKMPDKVPITISNIFAP